MNLHNLKLILKWKIQEILHVPYNIYMIIRFPFLNPRIGYFGQYCWYRSIPIGWRNAFGIQLCKEIKQSLKRNGYKQKEYIISDIKEKFGELRIYDAGAPKEVHDIICKYEYISSNTCIECGRVATRRSQGYILPYCDNCCNKNIMLYDKYYKDYDFYGYKC